MRVCLCGGILGKFLQKKFTEVYVTAGWALPTRIVKRSSAVGRHVFQMSLEICEARGVQTRAQIKATSHHMGT